MGRVGSVCRLVTEDGRGPGGEELKQSGAPEVCGTVRPRPLSARRSVSQAEVVTRSTPDRQQRGPHSEHVGRQGTNEPGGRRRLSMITLVGSFNTHSLRAADTRCKSDSAEEVHVLCGDERELELTEATGPAAVSTLVCAVPTVPAAVLQVIQRRQQPHEVGTSIMATTRTGRLRSGQVTNWPRPLSQQAAGPGIPALGELSRQAGPRSGWRGQQTPPGGEQRESGARPAAPRGTRACRAPACPLVVCKPLLARTELPMWGLSEQPGPCRVWCGADPASESGSLRVTRGGGQHHSSNRPLISGLQTPPPPRQPTGPAVESQGRETESETHGCQARMETNADVQALGNQPTP